MADRIVGLCGPGKGPKLTTNTFRNPVAKVCSLSDGHLNIVTEHGVKGVTESGEYPLTPTRFVQFEHVGDSKQLICLIIEKA